MYKRVISQAVLAVVSLDEAKNQLNIIDDTSEDDHVTLLIESATRLAQKYTGRLLSLSNAELVITGKQKFFMPFGEVEDITTAKVAGDPVNFTFEPISQILTITDTLLDTDEVKVTFDAGYKDGKAPFEAKMGVLMMLSSLYENREDTVEGSVSNIPLNSTRILDAIKLVDM